MASRELFNDPPGVTITIGDQGSADFWEIFARSNMSFDIILDDGACLPPGLLFCLTSSIDRYGASNGPSLTALRPTDLAEQLARCVDA